MESKSNVEFVLQHWCLTSNIQLKSCCLDCSLESLKNELFLDIRRISDAI